MARQTNALFDTKTIRKFCGDIQITDKQRDASQKWLKLLDDKKLEDETKNYFRFGQIILQDILGYNIEDIDFESDNVEFTFTDKNGKKIVCIEAKGTSTKDLFAPQHRTKKEQETPIKQTWDNMGRGYDYGICTNYQDFILLSKDVGYYKYHKFNFLSVANNEEQLKEFIGIFSRERIIEKTFIKKLYEESILAEREFTKEFYKLFHETRLMFIKEFMNNPDVSKQDAIHYTQIYLNRMIFMFFAEDHNFIPNRIFTSRILDVLKTNLITEHSNYVSIAISNLFRALNKGSKIEGIFEFNGGLFEKEIPPNIFFSDLRDSKFFEDVKQQSKLSKNISVNKLEEKILKKYENSLNPIINNLLMMDSFDFTSEVNVNILGHIFEQSISDLEKLGEEEISKRKEEGVYYTPEYITDYICRNTIIPYLSKLNAVTVFDLVKEYSGNIKELEDKIRNIKILDPACGSGAFLIKSVDILLEIDKEIEKYKPQVMEQRGIEEYSQTKEIYSIIENSIYGVDINEESIEITKLSLFLKLAGRDRKLIGLSKNIKMGNSIINDKNIDNNRSFDWEHEFPEVMQFGKFDIIIGNPPYGATLSEIEQDHLNKKFNIGSTDTAQLMIMMSQRLLKDSGYNGFIVPKALIFASNWANIRSTFLHELITLIDVGKVWKEVKLEQAVYILRKGIKSNEYWNGRREGEYLHAPNLIDKKYFTVFGFFISGVNEAEIKLGERILSNSQKLEKFVNNSRGEIYQKFVKEDGDTIVLGGTQIQRYHTSGIYGYINKNQVTSTKAYVKKDSILAQRMVAHILNPIDHIKITATISEDTDFIIIDTINQIYVKDDQEVSPYYILGLLNSKIINWYVYRFIVGRAIRTIQLDNPVTKRIPIIIKNETEIVTRVKELLRIGPKLNQMQEKFLDNVKTTFSLDKINNKITEFYTLDPIQLFKEINKLNGKNISLEKSEEWIEYFKKRQTETIKLRAEFYTIESEVNKLFYEVFGLNELEIEMVEKTTPE